MPSSGSDRPPDPPPLHPSVWKVCAGSSVHIPAVNSRVYYFPQGHAEQASSSPDFSSVFSKKACVLCKMLSVRLLANKDTDEVFAKFQLEPVDVSQLAAPPLDSSSVEDPGDDGDGVASFAKRLTPSDANNGGGFSVPRFCADAILPQMDLNHDTRPPVQYISILDLHGTLWTFRHIFRGKPRRHLFTTGWSSFVNSKKLVAGDSVILIKKGSGELFVGVRRALRNCGPTDYFRYTVPTGSSAPATPDPKQQANTGGGDYGFSRNCKGRVPPESIVEAVRLAGKNNLFEVMHYPGPESPDFVVRADKVDAAMKIPWTAGMRVRMAVEAQVSSKIIWVQGTVSCIGIKNPGPWPPSPWRMLQVTWDDPNAMKNVESVSPWEVELALATTQIPSSYIASKKLRTSQSPELLTDGDGRMFFSMSRSTSALKGILGSSLHNPAGMQGARHDSISITSNNQQRNSDGLHENNMPQNVSHVSTELSIGSRSQSESLSPPSQDSIHYQSTGSFRINQVSSKTKETRSASFQLFGKTIQMEQPIDGVHDKEFKKTEGTLGPLDVALFHSQTHMQEENNDPLQRASEVERAIFEMKVHAFALAYSAFKEMEQRKEMEQKKEMEERKEMEQRK